MSEGHEATAGDAKTVRILSIDGGGIRGILPARLLQDMERRLGAPIAERFHLIAGTSTGGILGCGLVRGLSPGALGDLYARRGGEIFSRSLWHTAITLDNLNGPKYAADTLERILAATLGDAWLSQVAGPELLVPSYCIHLPKPVPIPGEDVLSTRTPMLFKSWRARDAARDAVAGGDPRDYDFPLRAVARATSAAPTYFPPAMVKNRRGETYAMVDGGVFANNPAMCALASARRLYPEANDFLLVSLGTGSLEREIDPAKAASWGEIGWLHPILSLLMDGNADTVCYEADQMLGAAHWRFEISTGTDPTKPTTANEDFDDADADNIARLENLAAALVERNAGKLDLLCAELAKPKWQPPPAPPEAGPAIV